MKKICQSFVRLSSWQAEREKERERERERERFSSTFSPSFLLFRNKEFMEFSSFHTKKNHI
jgi:hypothetical protein